jgi:hypothetical protein
LTRDEYETTRLEQGGADVPDDEWQKWCQQNFADLAGSFASSVYRERYASVVITFSGLNVPCVGLGGLWVGYQTDRKD